MWRVEVNFRWFSPIPILQSSKQKSQTDSSSTQEGYVSIVCHEADNHVLFHNASQLGQDLASSMIKDGADAILKAAKHTTKEEILAEHAKRKLKAEAESEAASTSKVPKVEGIPEPSANPVWSEREGGWEEREGMERMSDFGLFGASRFLTVV